VNDAHESTKSLFLATLFIMVAAIAFVLAMFTNLMGGMTILGVYPEGFSRASTNISLIVIAVGVWFKK